MKKFLSFALLCFCFTAPASAQYDDGDTVDPPVKPSPAAAVAQTRAGGVAVVFFVDVQDAQVELTSCCDGAKVYELTGSVRSNQRVAIDTNGLCKGTYTLRVKIGEHTILETPISIP